MTCGETKKKEYVKRVREKASSDGFRLWQRFSKKDVKHNDSEKKRKKEKRKKTAISVTEKTRYQSRPEVKELWKKRKT